MNKNLKKVISAVAALSLSASSIAALAVDYSDVDTSASYAKAVNELSALNIINGYEDGTFKPDGLVTRAEITKMIVAALGETNAAAAGEGQDTQFADVTGEHWAAGFIAQGVADGFINGHSDTEFAPDDNVTYVQAQKMLVAATGYGTYALAQGGWPSGYKIWANSLDITSGISGISDNTELTRAQVAQMIDNAMDAPLCEVERYETDSWTGQLQPVLTQMNGTGKGYQTLFTRKHNTYKVYGRVTDTSKTTSMNTDVVNFQVEKADNFDDQYVKSTEPLDTQEMYIGTSKADEYLRVYSEALIQKDDNDEYTILTLTPAAANKSVTLAAEDYDPDKTNLASGVIYFFPAGTTKGSVKYELADSVDLYVNGVKDDRGLTDDTLAAYIADNTTASVTLQKETEVGSTTSSSKYNVVMVSTYETAVVENVEEKSTYTTVNFKDVSGNIKKSTMRIEDDTDDLYTYNFTLDGEAISVTDLQEFDVLSIAYDQTGNFEDSRFYDVIVSRDTAEGKCTSTNEANEEYTIGGTKYKVAQGMSITPELSATYFLYLDHFGNIAYLDESATAKKLGVVKQVYQKSNGDWVGVVITKEGTEEEYKVDSDIGELYNKTLAAGGDKLDLYPYQVVEYKVSSSSNKLTLPTTTNDDNEVEAAFENPAVAVDQEYKASSDKIGSVRISDATVILDISDADLKDEVRVITKDSLVDGQTYTAYGYDRSSTDSTYRFVLVSGTGDFTSETQLAIYNGSELVEDGDDDRTAYNLVIEGEEKQVLVDDDCTTDDFAEGDVVVYATNAAGYITKIENVFTSTSMLDGKTYAQFRDMALAADEKDIINTALAADLSDSNEEVDLVFGVVYNKNGNLVSIGMPEVSDGTYFDNGHYFVNYGKGLELDTSEAKVYTYNFAGSSRYSKVILDNGLSTTLDSKNKEVRKEDANGNYVLDLSHEEMVDEIVFAVARVIDNDIAQEIYLIVNED